LTTFGEIFAARAGCIDAAASIVATPPAQAAPSNKERLEIRNDQVLLIFIMAGFPVLIYKARSRRNMLAFFAFQQDSRDGAPQIDGKSTNALAA
jgi:hypothetical protein